MSIFTTGSYCVRCGQYIGPYGFHHCPDWVKPHPSWPDPSIEGIRRVVREEIQKALRELEESKPWQRPW